MKDRVEKIRCDDPDCTTVVAERRRDGTIIIRARHHGEEHITIIEPLPQTPQQASDVAIVGASVNRTHAE